MKEGKKEECKQGRKEQKAGKGRKEQNDEKQKRWEGMKGMVNRRTKSEIFETPCTFIKVLSGREDRSNVSPLERMQEVGHAVPEVYIRYMQGTAHYPQNGVWTLSLHETDRRRAGKTDGKEMKSECEMEKKQNPGYVW